MKLPTKQQAVKYFDTYKVPNNIKSHCYKVNQVALFLATKLQEAGEDINMEKVDRLSLLHDMFKAIVIRPLKTDPKFKCYPTAEQIDFWQEMQQKYPNMHETQVFHAEFQDDFPEFCTLMKTYGDHDVLTSTKSIEEQVVHYADWRVLIDQIIPLQQRIDDLRIRYSQVIEAAGLELWEKRVKDELVIEKQICEKINIEPHDLARLVP